MSKSRVLRDLVEFLRVEKKYWLIPIALVFAMLGLFVAFAQSSALAPLIYTLF